MYRIVIPRCEIEGPRDPVSFNHMGLQGAVPRKCSTCNFLFEGGCLRAMEQTSTYVALDHGPCPVIGNESPVEYESRFIKSKVFIPEKCSSCVNLEFDFIRGFICNYKRSDWGEFPRELDWGSWSPEFPNIGLRSGKSVSQEVLKAVINNNEVEAIKAFRSDHKNITIKEAREAFLELNSKINRIER